MFSWWFLLLHKTEPSQPPRASFHLEGLKVITVGSGTEGKAKLKPLLGVKSREKPGSSSPTPGPSMGCGEEQEEVNRSVALKLASFTPIITLSCLVSCFLPSWRQPGRASSLMTNGAEWRSQRGVGAGNHDASGKVPPTAGWPCCQPGPRHEGQSANGLPATMRL